MKGAIIKGPTGCPLMMENNGVAQGCVISDVTLTGCDLDFGVAAQAGPTAYLTNISRLTLSGLTLRGRRKGQFLRAVKCQGLTLTGELWDTIPGSSATDMIQLESCGDYNTNVVVYSAGGSRLGSIKTSNTGKDTSIRYIGLTGS